LLVVVPAARLVAETPTVVVVAGVAVSLRETRLFPAEPIPSLSAPVARAMPTMGLEMTAQIRLWLVTRPALSLSVGVLVRPILVRGAEIPAVLVVAPTATQSLPVAPELLVKVTTAGPQRPVAQLVVAAAVQPKPVARAPVVHQRQTEMAGLVSQAQSPARLWFMALAAVGDMELVEEPAEQAPVVQERETVEHRAPGEARSQIVAGAGAARPTPRLLVPVVRA